tara:strand:+ start:490 stop:663 length:174 start_codon:yes stop_codon:yes gene_type:complete
MGEAKKRKEAGLAPKKKKSNPNQLNILKRYPRLPFYAAILLTIFLIIDWIKLNAVGH